MTLLCGMQARQPDLSGWRSFARPRNPSRDPFIVVARLTLPPVMDVLRVLSRLLPWCAVENKNFRDRCRRFEGGDIGHDADLSLKCRVEIAW